MKKIHYKHDLGQHFLYDEALLAHLVESTGITKEENVLEIGAGSGMLTTALCQQAHSVVSVEVDAQVIPFLRLKTEGFTNLTIVQGDIRKQDLSSLCAPLGEDFYVIANIPYNISTPIFLMLWQSNLPIKQISVMIQKEVAEKLVATPKSSAYSYTSVLCQYYCVPHIVTEVPKEAFTPPPKVDSAFVTMQMRKTPPLPVANEKLLFRIMKANFLKRRKTLTNALSGVVEDAPLRAAMTQLGMAPTLRGEKLTIEEWITLANTYNDLSS